MKERIKVLNKMLFDKTHYKYRKESIEDSILNEDTKYLPLQIRKALAFKKAVEEMPIYIQDLEIIIGGRTIFSLPRYHTAEEIERSKHSRNNIYDPIFNNVYNESVDEIGDKAADTNPINYQKLLKNGIGWYKRNIEKKQTENKSDIEKQNFYKASIIVLEGVQNYIQRYADLILDSIPDVNNEQRIKELEEMREGILQIKEGPPKTFIQGVQLMHFMHTLFWIEAVCLVSLERMDQNLIDLYENDLKNNNISKDEAIEIIECFFIKLNFDIDRPNNRFEWLKGDTGQTITLGGSLPENSNKNGENKLTFIIIKALKELKLIDPNVHIRINKNSTDNLWNEVIDLVSKGNGQPIIDFDSNIIEGLRNVGIYSEQDISNYCGTGCWEIIIGGKTSYRQCANIDLLRPLEWLLFNGLQPFDSDKERLRPIDDKYTGINFEDLDNFKTFEELFEGYKNELRYYIMLASTNVITTKLAYNPLLSIFVDDCLEKGKDIKDGGARYKETDFQACSLANIADSLYTIKKIVFEENRYSLKEIVDILKNNYQGYETLRQEILNKLEKFGNDNDEVDYLAKEVAEFFSNEVIRNKNGWGGPFRARIAGASSYVDNIDQFAASPDGRKVGDYTSHNSSPQIGCDKNGPTSIVKSLTKIDTSKFAGGFILDLKFSKDVFRTDSNRQKILNFLKSYEKLGGLQMQINVVDSDVLKDAQVNPEKHKDLIVRVWGFSAYFIDLPKEFQDHVINRSENIT